MKLALFDLDNTLLDGDSDYLWGEFLIARGLVDGDWYRRENDRFYERYKTGDLDIREFLRFALQPLAEHPRDLLESWRNDFLEEQIMPRIGADALKLVDHHREQGETPLIITATNRFVTEPIAQLFGINHLLATEPEVQAGQFTGEVSGTPCFQDGKLIRLRDWLNGQTESLAEACFYSDSHNDLPLLEAVGHPVAVNPDPALAAIARERAWPVMRLSAD
ncbi:HAD superfamily hydrolase (TIGR01490 family) [Natronospira proteinivora]|uniref:HAD superfamily hydrolase (TIGR01490 family) n=1 Tax=Natronospira proteinivora TaxID=1807133 RepID=A0ABT1GBN1_9GAMM|nr:HAD family hydrolase [Natronospira proteinivora]MCP1728472.1 HAD superfamily hydrolase (TIGR01490 family) [Natronospira proteinivora]